MVAIANSNLSGFNYVMSKGTVCKISYGRITYGGVYICDEGSQMAKYNFIIMEEDLLNKIIENKRR